MHGLSKEEQDCGDGMMFRMMKPIAIALVPGKIWGRRIVDLVLYSTVDIQYRKRGSVPGLKIDNGEQAPRMKLLHASIQKGEHRVSDRVDAPHLPVLAQVNAMLGLDFDRQRVDQGLEGKLCSTRVGSNAAMDPCK